MATNSNSYKVEDLIQNGTLVISDGYRAKSDQFVPDGIPFARIPNVVGRFYFKGTDLLSKDLVDPVKRSRPGDVVFTSKGTVGRFALVQSDTPEFVYSPQLCFWRSLKPDFIDPIWLYYWMHGRQFYAQFKSVAGQTDMAEYVSLKDQRMMTIDIPPLVQQRRIAGILGALDDKIEMSRRINETLEHMARALFKSWFIDFDPVHAKAGRRQPAGMDKATADLFPDSFVDSELGKIPKGWTAGSVYEISEVKYGAPFASSLFNSTGTGKPLVRIRDLADESPAVFTTEVHPKGYLLQPGDIAVGMDGEFRAYLWAGIESWLNQRICVFAPKDGFSAAFVRNSIMGPLSEVESTETATTVIHLGKNDIDRFKVVIPNTEIAKAFRHLCQPWYDQVVANKQQSRTLSALRDLLLPKLLSGEYPIKAHQ